MCYDKFNKSYRFEMPSNYANSLSFKVASYIFNFFDDYTNGISVKLNKTCYKALQEITGRLHQQKPSIYAKIMIGISVLFIRACAMLSELHNVNIHKVDTSLNYPFVVHVNGLLSSVELYNKF